MRLLLPLLLLGAAAPALAQIDPRPGGHDPRIQVIDYEQDQVFRIQAAQGYQVTLQLGPDERIENVAVGDAGAWQVAANARGDLLFVKPLREGVTTNLTVATDIRLYTFELAPLYNGAPNMAYMVRFNYPAESEEVEEPEQVAAMGEGRYRLSGTRALRPAAISDDGTRTYIEWPEDAALPAVFTIDAQGREALVNGNMRDGLYVIDSVLDRLLFRIDRSVARAVRITPGDS
jgi:type IV secretion system protein VirB9